MTLEQVKIKIEKYLNSTDIMPRIVNVSKADDLVELKNYFEIGNIKFIDMGYFASVDSMPLFDKLLNSISKNKDITFLYGISTFLKLLGSDIMNLMLRNILEIVPQNKVIIILVACDQYIKLQDPRIVDRGAYIAMCDDCKPIKLTLINKSLAKFYETNTYGINQISKLIELIGLNEILIETKHKRHEFPDSIFEIHERNSAYEGVVKLDSRFATLRIDEENDAFWGNILEDISERGWDDIINMKFGGKQNLHLWVRDFANAEKYEKWVFFLAIKTFGISSNDYLSYVVEKSKSVEDFTKLIFNAILDFDIKDRMLFNNLYCQRKSILKNFSNYTEEIVDFCKRLYSKKDNALFYLTDNSMIEKEYIFEHIAINSRVLSRERLIDILNLIYPDLKAYMQKYNFNNCLLDEYFLNYKYLKIINLISESHKNIVDKQAIERDYNACLNPRSFFVNSLNFSKAITFFVDAMGVEYLSFIQVKCAQLGLNLKINVARCELPSLTCFNKDFKEIFKQHGVDVLDIKDLDELKHGGVNRFDYTKNKLPIHLISELDLIENMLKQVVVYLSNPNIERVFLISDHGSSRLAVINESENTIEMVEKGIHSGRCCLMTDSDEIPKFATSENGYWCLANYDRFKGGRKACVEVHGGATLEEVAIPIIEVTKKNKKIECNILDGYETIFISFKKKAEIKLFISTLSEQYRILINGKFYSAKLSDVKYHYDFVIPDIKKSGNYLFDLYDGDNIVVCGLSFIVKKEGSNERNLFA